MTDILLETISQLEKALLYFDKEKVLLDNRYVKEIKESLISCLPGNMNYLSKMKTVDENYKKNLEWTDEKINITQKHLETCRELFFKQNKEIETIINLFEKHGQSDYIGEPVTQTEHMIQSAMLAEEMELDNDTIVACLLHDVGHLLPNKEQMSDLGVKNHEKEGANYLRSLGFNEKVSDLVENHVNAKRYLVSVDENYRKNLSSASNKTLEFQGGLMSEEEIKEFKKKDNFDLYLILRDIDDQAKVKDKNVNKLEYYIHFMKKCLNK